MKKLSQKINRTKGIIISYPRSGLNWVRYCAEYLTGLRTPGRIKLHGNGKLAFYRTHNVHKQGGPNSCCCAFHDEQDQELHDKAVLLLRNYRESFIRVGRNRPKGIPSVEAIRTGNVMNFRNYFENIQAFDKFSGKKILIWYHDLVKDFSNIEKILEFFQLSYNSNDFDIEYHRQKSFEIYDRQHKSYTRNTLMDFDYHQRIAPSDILNALDEFVHNNYPDLADKYLHQKAVYAHSNWNQFPSICRTG